jgi:hypothetical protein
MRAACRSSVPSDRNVAKFIARSLFICAVSADITRKIPSISAQFRKFCALLVRRLDLRPAIVYNSLRN